MTETRTRRNRRVWEKAIRAGRASKGETHPVVSAKYWQTCAETPWGVAGRRVTWPSREHGPLAGRSKGRRGIVLHKKTRETQRGPGQDFLSLLYNVAVCSICCPPYPVCRAATTATVDVAHTFLPLSPFLPFAKLMAAMLRTTSAMHLQPRTMQTWTPQRPSCVLSTLVKHVDCHHHSHPR